MPNDSLVILPQNLDRSRDFFHRLQHDPVPEHDRYNVILIMHLLPDCVAFLEALSNQVNVVAIVPKSRSVYTPVRRDIERGYTVLDIDRRALAETNRALSVFAAYSRGRPTALLDIGGYFAPALEALHAAYPATLLGVVEGTENGHQRYERLTSLPVPVVSVARSPLKEPEDHLTGEAIVFSTERLLRACGEILGSRQAAVFGYGKIGRGIARALRARGVCVRVVEPDPARAIEAVAHGFSLFDKPMALVTADLLVGATGNYSLSANDFDHVRDGAFIVSATSSDDELELSMLSALYDRQIVRDSVARYSRGHRHFYLVNEGNAVNFLDGAILGPSIHLVQGELLIALALLQQATPLPPGIHAVPSSLRRRIARSWLDVFNSPAHAPECPCGADHAALEAHGAHSAGGGGS